MNNALAMGFGGMFFRRLSLSYFFLSVTLLVSADLIAQNDIYTFNQISYEQGLPGVNVRNIFQDSRGVMWISVEAMGICKYYGDKFIQYRNNPQDTTTLSSNFANAILEDEKGNVWVATDKGLNKYDRERDIFIRYFRKSGLTDNIINQLFIDSEGSLWACTGNGLNRYDDIENTFEHFLYTENPALNDTWNVKAVYEDRYGYLWLGTNKGLVKFNPKTEALTQWQKSSDGGLSHNLVNCLAFNKNTLWLGTHRGISKFDMDTEKFIPWKYERNDREDLNHEGINHIYYDKNGSLWIGTYTKGIVIVNSETGEYRRITNSNSQQNGLKSNHIKYIYKDKTGTMWIASKFEGLFLHDLNKMIFSKWPARYNTFLDIKGKHILDFFADWKYQDVYWVASKFDGLYRVDTKNEQIKNYKHNIYRPTTINTNRIHAVIRDYMGDLYVGSEDGLDLFVEEAQEFDHITNIPVDVLAAGKNGTLWMGSANGVFIFNRSDGIVKRHQSKHDFFRSEFKIRFIFEDSQKKIWFSTDLNGAYLYDPERDELKKFLNDPADASTISGNMVRPVFEDSKGNIWIGTKANGLNKFDRNTGKFSCYTISQGLPTNFILSIEEDKDGNLWVATHNGLSKFDPENNLFTNFNTEYGLQNNIFEIGVSNDFSDGCLLFGGHNGFNIFNTDSITHKHTVPQLIISSIKVLDKEIQRDVVEPEALLLDHKENYLTFEFGLTDYNKPAKHQFAYKLEGLDNNWSLVGNRNYASYSSLAPKEYTLKIRGANELGIWNNDGINIKIIIKPPFYDTAIFKVAIAICFLLMGFTFYWIKTRKNKKTKMLLESKIKERTQKLQNALKELKDQQIKIESQNEKLSTQYEKILSQNNHIQRINSELQKAHKELKEINSELDQRVKDRTEKLVKTNQELDRFVYSASHDLSAPLKSILGLINIAKFENKEKSLANNLGYMERSVKKLEDVIKSLTQFSRNMGHEVKKTNILFDEIIDDILAESTVAYKTDNFEVIKDYNPDTIIYSDYLRMRIILTNLVSNAFKYKKPEEPRPVIKITFLKDEKHYVIKVKDNGIGISKENQKKVFDMFFRATNHSEGSGLGLYIVIETLTKLNGIVELKSEPEKFTEFTIKLPFVP